MNVLCCFLIFFKIYLFFKVVVYINLLRYIYYWNLQFLNYVIIIKTNCHAEFLYDNILSSRHYINVQRELTLSKWQMNGTYLTFLYFLVVNVHTFSSYLKSWSEYLYHIQFQKCILVSMLTIIACWNTFDPLCQI